ncbi:MAG: hypothetical protein H7Y27_11990 [Gemmatimonadaceae bacterium]|nr:hypothetical protein [Chitinophagaceae bacterium]
MKKSILIPTILVAMIFGATSTVSAQTKPVTPFKPGTVTLALGVGVGAQYKGNYYNTGFGTKAALEVGVWKAGPGTISIGGQVGGSFSNNGPYNDYKARTFIVAGRSAWHYGWQVPGLDTYAGLSAGVGFHNYGWKNGNNNNDDDYNEVIPVLGAFVGASYFVTPKFGFNAEAGYDITQVQAGVIFRF